MNKLVKKRESADLPARDFHRAQNGGSRIFENFFYR